MQRPIVISIAGFDPSGGAGLLADIKTFEQHKVYGLAVSTAQTVQTENEFFSIKWEDEQAILQTLKKLMHRYKIAAIKIGIVENATVLNSIVTTINGLESSIKIVWDTVIKSSSGFSFWSGDNDANLYVQTLSKITLITPNYNEALLLYPPAATAKEAALFLSAYCPVLLKGGHNEWEPGIDYLYCSKNIIRLSAGEEAVWQKHGSGCVLSAAITANLAKGKDVLESSRKAKAYIEQFLNSNKTLLGYHHV